MQVLSDAQWARFEAAIAAVKLRKARPRKEDRRTIAAVMRLRPEARKLWFSKVRSRISSWRWKNTARRSALLASPLLRPAWLR